MSVPFHPRFEIERNRILDLLKEKGPLTFQQVLKESGLNQNDTGSRLYTLQGMGLIELVPTDKPRLKAYQIKTHQPLPELPAIIMQWMGYPLQEAA